MIKNIFSPFFLSIFSFFSCQNFAGIYKSKNGSILELRKDSSYEYVKQHLFSHYIDRELLKYGTFEIKNNILVLKKEKIRKEINKINILEVKSTFKRIDSVILNLKLNTDQVSAFICDTGLQKENSNLGYSDNCFRLYHGNNKVPIFNSENFHFKLYPNTEDGLFRMNFDNIYKLYYRSKDFSKICLQI